jgi:hypothetical protein
MWRNDYGDADDREDSRQKGYQQPIFASQYKEIAPIL